MFSKFLLYCSIAVASSWLSATAFSQASISGEIRGVDGRPFSGAEVKVERKDTKAAPVVLKTDARGRFAASNLPAGKYSVTAQTGGHSAQQSVVLTQARPATVSMRLAQSATTTTAKKKKRLVWVPAGTGSRIGGGYQEIDDSSDDPNARRDRDAIERMSNTQATTTVRNITGGR